MEKHRDHALLGKWVGSKDCHIEPDWILIYRNEADSLFLERSGSTVSSLSNSSINSVVGSDAHNGCRHHATIKTSPQF
ncbi:type II toxin-antitoxin system mRNA interferase toxin, RelE/StbE family [Thalassobacterium maritimum]|uniref:type II toxin-antitoxin system mRNA interferase toxin, RelE/StbE family n=1 Tax=Thalassobacterium maritimum TaxID=3041265 RepID=UPI0031F32F2A